MPSIDLNADLGEGCGSDAELMPLLSSASIACGGHAGDAASMRECVRLALRHAVRIGAHPSYPDREHFGRRSLVLPPETLLASLSAQYQALAAICREEGASIAYVKPHGALYNDACRDAALAARLAGWVATLPGAPALMGLPGSRLAMAAQDAGLRYQAEGFADRAYRADGALLPRSEPGALLDDAAALAQVRELVLHQQVRTKAGESVKCRIDTLCLHGDNPAAIRQARQIRGLLDTLSVTVTSAQM
ncbi:5-oxoprolinase subunit PxpA [Chitinilyticum litopenaei]|uniref:5-oxoprolinase subunit PxpA n=1 Tax=Chitinilyticum litopenaei TaxID=1121276 RepID=UPI000404204C|nr:5-oxoprolinase subunit PxpA [Chitinilyticum litopenaei]